jgi:tripeptidyl-peptidase I
VCVFFFKACNAYHLPVHVSPHVEMVTPSIYFDTVLHKGHFTSLPAKKMGLPGIGITSKTTGKNFKMLFKDLQNCDKMMTPLCLRVLYGFFYQPLASDRNTFGIGQIFLPKPSISQNMGIIDDFFIYIVEYTPQAYRQSDLDTFAKNFSLGMVGKSPRMVSIDGGSSPHDANHFISENVVLSSKKAWCKPFRRSLITMENPISTCNML